MPDVAYHVTKWERGFTRAINVQGADHHSTVTRVRAGLQALDMGIPPGYPEYVLHQMVTVMRGGEEVKISKRAGSYVTVRDLDRRGRARRGALLLPDAEGRTRSSSSTWTSRARSREENPVYYIQMAHARLSGIFRVGEIDPASIDAVGARDLAPLVPEPRSGADQGTARLSGARRGRGGSARAAPRRRRTCTTPRGCVHLWYHKHHVLGEPEPIMRARLVLARAGADRARNGLAVLGITAPERM